MKYVILAMRAAMIVVCIETGIRYARWWYRVGPSRPSSRHEWRRFFRVLIKGDEEHGILPILMLGITFVQIGLGLRHLDILYYDATPNRPIWFTIVLASDGMMLLGTLAHLLPAWEMAPNMLNRDIGTALLIRTGIIATICAVIVALDLGEMLSRFLY